MILRYKAADGKTHDWEVAEEVGGYYLAALEEEKQNERRETRRHTSLSRFTYEDARYFAGGTDMFEEIALAEAVSSALAHLSERQRRLFAAVYIEGWNYTELAAIEGRDESTIRKAVMKAKEKFIKIFSSNYPVSPSAVAYSVGRSRCTVNNQSGGSSMRELTFEEMDEVAGGDLVVAGLVIGLLGIAVTAGIAWYQHNQSQQQAAQLQQMQQLLQQLQSASPGSTVILPNGTQITIPNGVCFALDGNAIRTYSCSNVCP